MTGRPSPRTLAELSELFAAGNYAGMLALAQRLSRKHTADATVLKAVGVACAALGRDLEAIKPLQRAARIAPADATVHANLAQALAAVGRAAEAEPAYRRALAIDRNLANAWSGLGALLAADGRLAEAIECLSRSVALRPESAAFWNRLGNALRSARKSGDARAAYERAIGLRPDIPDTYTNLGLTLADLGATAAAEGHLRKAVAMAPECADFHTNLGHFLLEDLGRVNAACECYEKALELQPASFTARSNYLFALNYQHESNSSQMKEAAREFGRQASSLAAGHPSRTAPHCEAGPLRVGLVSGDFRMHPVGYFLETVLAHLPRDRVEMIGYPTQALEDEVTRRLRPHFSLWRPIGNLGDQEAAARIAADGVDLLLDLAGHTAHNRLPLFAWRPARVQATWLGYYGTTGVEQIDWLIADAVSIPPGDEVNFTERVWRLPGSRLCFTPPENAPAVAPAPVIVANAVTFGSFQNLAKINDEVLLLWSRVLALVPGSRLRVQNAQFRDPQVQLAFRARLARLEVDPGRATLAGPQDRAAYLAAYAEVDIVLDTFPFPGGTTTCEGLWMGVPTVTLVGETMIARQGHSLLEAAGLGDWAAHDADGYVARAVGAARDPRALSLLRSCLRERLRASTLCDAERFTHELAEALRSMHHA